MVVVGTSHFDFVWSYKQNKVLLDAFFCCFCEVALLLPISLQSNAPNPAQRDTASFSEDGKVAYCVACYQWSHKQGPKE
jgi:hypothetical protein